MVVCVAVQIVNWTCQIFGEISCYTLLLLFFFFFFHWAPVAGVPGSTAAM
jgi:hypothetical protein